MSDGVLFGFKLTGVDTTFKEVDMPNYKSATNSAVRDTAEETIRDEIRQGNYVISATKPTVVSALGAIQKSPPPPPGSQAEFDLSPVDTGWAHDVKRGYHEIIVYLNKNEKSENYSKADLKQRVLFFITIFRLAIPTFFRFTDVSELM